MCSCGLCVWDKLFFSVVFCVVIAVHKFDFRLVIHGTLNKWRPINESHVMTDSCSVIASVVTLPMLFNSTAFSWVRDSTMNVYMDNGEHSCWIYLCCILNHSTGTLSPIISFRVQVVLVQIWNILNWKKVFSLQHFYQVCKEATAQNILKKIPISAVP